MFLANVSLIWLLTESLCPCIPENVELIYPRYVPSLIFTIFISTTKIASSVCTTINYGEAWNGNEEIKEIYIIFTGIRKAEAIEIHSRE
jgi:hypothetical protein